MEHMEHAAGRCDAGSTTEAVTIHRITCSRKDATLRPNAVTAACTMPGPGGDPSSPPLQQGQGSSPGTTETQPQQQRNAERLDVSSSFCC
jgi:hypothetical protein